MIMQLCRPLDGAVCVTVGGVVRKGEQTGGCQVMRNCPSWLVRVVQAHIPAEP